MFGSAGMLGVWVDLVEFISWYVLTVGGHLCWRLLLCSSIDRLQFGHMLWDSFVFLMLHVRQVLFVLGLREWSYVWR